MTGRYLTETKSSGRAPVREQEEERVFLTVKAAFIESLAENEMPFQGVLRDGWKEREEKPSKSEGGKENNREEKIGRKLLSLCFSLKDILTGQSPLRGKEWNHFEVSYQQLEGSREQE